MKYFLQFTFLSLLASSSLDQQPFVSVMQLPSSIPFIALELNLQFPVFQVSSWFLPSFWWSPFSGSILRKGIESEYFETLVSGSVFYFLLSHILVV